MKKLMKQLTAIFSLVLGFAVFDLTLYNVCTKPCIPDTSSGMQAKSIELDKYLPFEENSEIVKMRSDFQITDDIPVIDGAAALYPICSAAVNAVYPEDSVKFDGSDFTSESKLQMRNTRGAYKAVADGDADIIICAKPSAEQLAYAEEKSADLEMIPIGCEAFVFLVNGDNPVDDLSQQQIKDIFSGKCKNWSEAGGKNIPINALSRNKGSGSQTAMLSFMNGEDIRKNPIGFMGSSIGFSFRYYVEDVVENGNVKMLSIDGVYPDRENIANGNYPIVSNFYAVYDKNNDNPNIQPLIEWLLSEEGQRIIDETGYIPLS